MQHIILYLVKPIQTDLKYQKSKDLLFDEGYWFIERPNENWYKNLIEYLNSIEFDISLLRINPHFTKDEKIRR